MARRPAIDPVADTDYLLGEGSVWHTHIRSLAAVRDGVKDVASVVVTHASNSEMSLAIKSGLLSCSSQHEVLRVCHRICCRMQV